MKNKQPIVEFELPAERELSHADCGCVMHRFPMLTSMRYCETHAKAPSIKTALESILSLMEEQIDNKAAGKRIQFVKTFQTCIDIARAELS